MTGKDTDTDINQVQEDQMRSRIVALMALAGGVGLGACSPSSTMGGFVRSGGSTGSGGGASGTGGATGGGNNATGGGTSATGGASATGGGASATGGGSATGGAAQGGGTGTAGAGGGAAILASDGCGKAPPTAVGTIGTAMAQYQKFTIPISAQSVLQFNAMAGANQPVTRQYYVRLPDNYDSTKPYRVIYQGPGCSPAQDTQPTNLKAQPPLATDTTAAGAGARAGAILVQMEQGSYNPAAYNTTPGMVCTVANMTGCNPSSAYCFDDWASENGTPQVASIPDAQNGAVAMERAYFDALHKAIEANYCVDRTRQFFGGYSSGGWLAQQLGCWFPDVLRAQANVTGGIPPIIKANPSYCVQHPIGYFSIHNYPDPSNAFSGSVDGAFRVWTLNGCTGTFPRDPTTQGPPQPSTVAIPPGLEVYQVPGVPNTNTFRCYHYTTCPAAYPMYFCVSNLPANAQHDAQGTTAAAAFWEFFSRF